MEHCSNTFVVLTVEVPSTLFEPSMIATIQRNTFLYAAIKAKIAALKPLIGHVTKMHITLWLQHARKTRFTCTFVMVQATFNTHHGHCHVFVSVSSQPKASKFSKNGKVTVLF